MRPKDFRKTPSGAVFLYSLLLGLCVIPAAAQTRLHSSQVMPLKGAAQGSFASTKLRDMNSAVDHGDGVTNAIASAIQDCGVSYSCSILVPPSYGSAEAVPGYQLSYSTPGPGATTPGNIAIFDRRYGDARMMVNNPGYTVGLISTPSGWVYDYYSPAAQNAILSSFYIRQWTLDGGSNQTAAALGYANKTQWATMLLNSISHTPAQHVSVTLSGQTTSLGNDTPVNNLVACSGGYVTEGELGCHAVDNVVAMGNVEYSGTLSGSPSAGATSLTVTPTQGMFTQGGGRYLARMNAGTISGGSISQVTTSYNSANSITGSGTSWPVSTVIAQLGMDLNLPGQAVVTPTNFTVGSMAGISTSSLVCVSDSESFEMVYPSTVTGSSFSATFANIHPSNATISVGGLCGYLLDLTADDVTNATFPNKSQTITGTLHFAWPVIASTSMTSASVWVTGQGVWEQMASRWNASNGNGYVLYPFAEVFSAQQSGGLSNKLTVGPNNVGWTTGDTVSEFLYPSSHVLFGNSVVESYYPNLGATNGFGVQYNMPLQGNEAMLSLVNNGPRGFYASNGGEFGSPAALHLYGPTTQTFTADLPADYGTIGFGCTTTCNVSETLLAAQNNVYYDFLFYDAGNKHWNISANSNAVKYGLGSSQFVLPFSNVYITNDGNSNGYIATQQFRSSASTNSDTAGELVFTNATAATQVLQGSYASHPECWARPEFDAGSSNRHWITYGANSFTINFASAVTGVVTYSCTGRN